MGRGLMGWGDLTARRRDCAHSLGGCQRGLAGTRDSKRPTSCATRQLLTRVDS